MLYPFPLGLREILLLSIRLYLPKFSSIRYHLGRKEEMDEACLPDTFRVTQLTFVFDFTVISTFMFNVEGLVFP